MVRAQDGLHALDLSLPLGFDEGMMTEDEDTARSTRSQVEHCLKILDAFLQRNGKVVPRRRPKTVVEFFGIRRGIVVCEDNSALVFNYRIPKEEDALIDREGSPPPLADEHTQTTCFALSDSQRFSDVCADEESGRVVLVDASRQEMVVLDFALMHRDTL